MNQIGRAIDQAQRLRDIAAGRQSISRAEAVTALGCNNSYQALKVIYRKLANRYGLTEIPAVDGLDLLGMKSKNKHLSSPRPPCRIGSPVEYPAGLLWVSRRVVGSKIYWLLR